MTTSSPFQPRSLRVQFRAALCIFSGAAALLSNAAISHAQTGTALVRHAPHIAGRVDGSVQQMTAENVGLNGHGIVVTGDLLVPGKPKVLQNGRLKYGGTIDGAGSPAPSNYQVVLGSGISLRHVVRCSDPVVLPVVLAPALPTGFRNVVLRRPGQSAGDFSTLRDLRICDDVGQVAIPAGTYGTFSANDDSALVLGVAGATEPSVYNFQKLILNGGSRLCVVGPVIVNLGSELVLNRDRVRHHWRPERHQRYRCDADHDYDVAVGSPDHPEWLVLNIAVGGLKLDQDDSFHGFVNAPAGKIALEDRSSLVGGVIASRLSVTDRSRLRLLVQSTPPPMPNTSPTVSLNAPVTGSTGVALSTVTLQATAADADGSILSVGFYNGDALLGTSTTAPYQFDWTNLTPGTYTLTAKATDNSGASTVSAPVDFTVGKAPAAVTLDGLTQVYDGSAKVVSTSSLPGGLTILVTYDGLSSAPVGVGNHTVVATVDDTNYAGSATGTLVITPATPVVSWTAPAELIFGTALSEMQLNATANVAGTFSYNPVSGTVLDAGALQPLSVTFTPTDSVNYTSANASTTVNVNKAPATITIGALNATYDGSARSVTVSTFPAGLSFAVNYDGSAVAPSGAGNYTVVVTVNDTNYFGSATATLAIARATPVLTWAAPADIVYGTALSSTQLSATTTVFGSYEYTPSAGAMLNAGTAQALNVVFTPIDTANYTTASAATTINVGKAPAVVTLAGLSQTYNGTAKSVTASTLPLNLTVGLTYDGTATSPVNAGSYAVVGTVDDVNYTGSTTETLVIAKATPAVAWATPADILAGTALSVVQLNAAASVAGSFVYNPEAGTKLSAGSGQVLSATFTPADSANLNAVDVSTTINVTAPVAATITLDNVSSGTTATIGTSFTWSHVLTADGGADRVLIVGVVSRGSTIANASVANVTFNGVPMISIASSIANAGTSTVNRSQQFYLLDAALPAPGTYPIVVTFAASQSASNYPGGGAISLTNVDQAAPAGFTNNNLSAKLITTVVPASMGSWVVDTVGVGSSSSNLVTASPDMVQRFNLPQPGPASGTAGATKVADASGSVTMAWTSASAREVHSVAVFSPALSVPLAPSVTTPPASQTVNVGANVNFTVGVVGSSPLTYQWYKDGLIITGATANALSLTSVQTSAAGNYTVSVTNSLGSVISAPGLLTVNVVPPTITTQPVSQVVNLGESATFYVVATGSAPLSYLWYKDGFAISGATASSIILSNVQTDAAGYYQVVVSNAANALPSDVAVLTVNAAPVAPVITTQPFSQKVGVGSAVTFSVNVTGTAPLTYLWQKDGVDIDSSNSPTLALVNVQDVDQGTYQVLVSNTAGNAASNYVSLIVEPLTEPSAIYNLTGFATLGSGTTGGGVIEETAATYRKVYTALDLANALKASKTVGAVKVIEIMNDLNLGWNEIDPAVKSLASTPFRSHAAPKLHPALIISGVSLIDIQSKPGLTIFSNNGATIRHATFNFKGTSNIIVRNLKFDEMWEWDEASKGDYDSNDWDFIDLSNGSAVTNVWIDHCTFTKAYDGIVDMKSGTQYVTMSWCKYIGDDGAANTNSFVRQQIAALEANAATYPFYNFLRINGFGTEDIVQVIQGHDKGHLMGSNSLDAENATLSATFHHQWFQNVWDRCVPRLRAGQVHNYNLFVDNSVALAARRLRNERVDAMSAAARTSINSTYSFNPFLNGCISTEGGVILLEKSIYMDCLTPLRNNQTDVTNPLYTGKIMSTDCVYIFHEDDGSTAIQRGDSTDAGSRMGPTQAPIIPFSWNTEDGLFPAGYLTPLMDDPADLEYYLAKGCGAGTINWSKDNWLRTAY